MVVDDLFLSINKEKIPMITLIDFSSAFGTIDHSILVLSLHGDFGFNNTVLQWFTPYLTDSTHYVTLYNH